MKKLTLIEAAVLAIVLCLVTYGGFTALGTLRADNPPPMESQSGTNKILMVKSGPPPDHYVTESIIRDLGADILYFLTKSARTVSIVPGNWEAFSVHVPQDGPTNLTFKAYLATATASTNGNFSIANSGSPLGTNWFVVSGTNDFNGNQSIPVIPGEWKSRRFRLDPAAFTNYEQGDTLLVIIGSGQKTDGSNVTNYLGATLFTVDSPADGAYK